MGDLDLIVRVFITFLLAFFLGDLDRLLDLDLPVRALDVLEPERDSKICLVVIVVVGRLRTTFSLGDFGDLDRLFFGDTLRLGDLVFLTTIGFFLIAGFGGDLERDFGGDLDGDLALGLGGDLLGDLGLGLNARLGNVLGLL